MDADLLSVVKGNQFFRFRGKRGGRRKIATQNSFENTLITIAILTVVGEIAVT